MNKKVSIIFFRTREEFEEKNSLLGNVRVCTKYVGNYYGTPLDYVNKTLDEGYDVFLEIEVLGAMKVKEKVPKAFLFS